jgi:2-keto-4-pentenoate hydratase/2-oxohepta-3-ene-1,7-dioic acid hydratase in catechol pathway
MRIARYKLKHSSRVQYGVIEGDTVIAIEGSPFDGELRHDKEVASLSDVDLLAPCEPSKVVAGGMNYRGHAKEIGLPLPKFPVFFLKPPTSVIGSGNTILYPPETEQLEYEAELAVVVKHPMYRTAPEDVAKHVLGYTCVNDVTARDIQGWGGNFLHLCHSKCFETFCPTGPWIETDVDPSRLDMTLSVNGEIRQSTNTSDMIFGVDRMVSYFSHVMRLLPGDLILTGTPAGIGQMHPGDQVEVTIEGIGTLRNRVGQKHE